MACGSDDNPAPAPTIDFDDVNVYEPLTKGGDPQVTSNVVVANVDVNATYTFTQSAARTDYPQVQGIVVEVIKQGANQGKLNVSATDDAPTGSFVKYEGTLSVAGGAQSEVIYITINSIREASTSRTGI